MNGFLLPAFMLRRVGFALGCQTDNLPAFMVLPDSRGLPYQPENFSWFFL
jgi:hypothetical protein